MLSRFLHIIKDSQIDIVIRLTADNPFVDIAILDEAIQEHIRTGNDYTKTVGLPLGMNFEIVSAAALLQIENMPLTPEDREHVTLYIRNSSHFKTAEIEPDNGRYQHLRLTVDYASDYALASLLYSLMNEGENVGMEFIERIVQTYPWLFSINETNVQKQQFKTRQDETDAAVRLLNSLDMRNAAQLLNDIRQ